MYIELLFTHQFMYREQSLDIVIEYIEDNKIDRGAFQQDFKNYCTKIMRF